MTIPPAKAVSTRLDASITTCNRPDSLPPVTPAELPGYTRSPPRALLTPARQGAVQTRKPRNDCSGTKVGSEAARIERHEGQALPEPADLGTR